MDKLYEFIDISKKDSKAELECKLLSNEIKTKDIADKLMKTIQELSLTKPIEETIFRVSYPDSIRVEVNGPIQIQKVCATNSFKGIELNVQKKSLYHNENSQKDSLDVPDTYSRFTLRSEQQIRKDWDASPTDPKTTSVRLINRRSFITLDELFRIDFSMVKSRTLKSETLRDLLKKDHTYELEIEFIKKDTNLNSKIISEGFFKIINKILQSYQESEFILSPTQQQIYEREFKLSNLKFINPVTFKRKHLYESNPHSIWNDYTVTIKADGERSGLYVARDRNLLKITSRPLKIVWTGLKALNDDYHGTFVDGEFIPQKNLFCIFDIYYFKNKTTTSLPLFNNDKESRLNYCSEFVQSIQKDFIIEPTSNPMKIETKLFKVGDGQTMEKAIKELLELKYEYETDGLIFTPAKSPVAPKDDMEGNTWNKVYKWKPPHQNSIDFLLKLSNEFTFDPILDTKVCKGELYVTQRTNDIILYPCETMTGEFVQKELPTDLKLASEQSFGIPSLFYPSSPPNPNAYQILVPVDDKNIGYSEDTKKVETNTIIECSYNIETKRWLIMRTRYDKTAEFKQEIKKKKYGQDIIVADDIWNSIHVPVTEDMIKEFVSTPIEEIDDTYYIDIERKSRILQPSYEFHNKVIKMGLYTKLTKENSTLLELASGQGGDYHKWKKQKLAKVVGIEYSESNIKLACKRYVEDKKLNPLHYRPHVLYIKGTFNEPLYQQESPKFKILNGEEKASTKYLEQFENLKKFDNVSCQFAIHYACESEETFRVFAKNISMHCKDYFFGTCPDGKTVYSLLAGKQKHIFTDGKNVGGEYQKLYEDTEQWTESFGLGINVTMESFETSKEYLVPFQKITEIFKEEGFDLEESHMFEELYDTKTLSKFQTEFSFINRTFIFKKSSIKKEEPVEVSEEQETPKEQTEKPKRKLKKKTGGEIDEKDLPILFHGAGEDKGPYKFLDNQAEYPIQINDVKYPTIEHYFQAQKALEFGDDDIHKQIMKTPSAKAVKALGKKVRNFIKELWDSKRIEIMARGIRAKFVQHPELQKQLIDTGSKQIGEADARDSFWGIGTSSSTELSKDPLKWKGQNQLGKILMSLREEFKQL